jgi:hypothetical protein
MTRHRCLWSAVAVVFGVLALLCLIEMGVIPWPRPPGMKEKADAVRVGMTESEVDAIFGGPPTIKAPVDDQGGQLAVWYSPEGNVAVTYGDDGRVAAAPVFVLRRRR